MDFELTRHENDEKLLAKIESIKTAENIQVLIPFAKAYLGMFYVIDARLPAKEKVKLLANSKLADAIFEGFISSLNRKDLPSIDKIGHALAKKDEFAEGYVVLAAMKLIVENSLTDINNLHIDIIEKAIGFHLSNKTGCSNVWFDDLFTEQKHKVIPAISKYWVAMLKNKASFLPGRNLILGDKPDVQVAQYCVLPLLDNWSNCKEKTLLRLLHLAFKYSEASEFLMVCERALANDETLNEKTRLYWITSAYLLSPDKYFSLLTSYIGRVKLKVMPLLDFISIIMKDKNVINIIISDQMAAQLLRLVAPIFPPQHHVYGALGALDINSKNVMSLFYFLVCSNENNVASEIKLLRKARVMKIYSGVIDNLLKLHVRINKEENFTIPNFDDYIETLVKEDCLHGRSNKFDLN